MKHTFTCSLELETIQKIRDMARKSSFRNKSHLVEEAIIKFLGNFDKADLINNSSENMLSIKNPSEKEVKRR
ncbi:MAG: hypothetical protein ABIG89_06620 [Candidatus Woesearchaeota archaeon]